MHITVETKSGMVEGIQQDDLCMFKGVPYAAPPIGKRRWLPPEPLEPQSGVHKAHDYGPVAPQSTFDLSLFPPEIGQILKALGADVREEQSEDCLYLNIWSPNLDHPHRPVLLWIHGGSFTNGSGSSPLYDGRTLCRRGNAVIVTINYRLGPLGFLNLNEVTGGKIPATGNEGLLDQISALEWVRDNIEAFGGNPDNVTIFGESAGGMSVGSLLAMPSARGLFHKAILQSGTAYTIQMTDRAVRFAERLLRILGLRGKDVDAIRELKSEQLLTASLLARPQSPVPDPEISVLPFRPVVDGKVLPQLPIEAIKGGSADGISILVGSNLDEWNLFIPMDPEVTHLEESALVKRCRTSMPAVDVEEIIEVYRNARAKRGASTMPGDIYNAIQTDRNYRIPAMRLAETQHSRGYSAYNYLFTWPSPIMGGLLGACHALEQGFIFGTYEENFFGSGDDADTLAGNIQDAWLAFAHTGDPSCDGLGAWPPYGDRRATMLLGKECRVKQAVYEDEIRAWDSVPDAVIGSL